MLCNEMSSFILMTSILSLHHIVGFNMLDFSYDV